MQDVWRCSVCGKTKPLSGSHLSGKNSVRSDCWPCAKKQTFTREAAKGGGGAQAPFLYTTTTPPPTSAFASAFGAAARSPGGASAFEGPPASKKYSPFLGKDTVASVGTFTSAFTAVNTVNNAKKTVGPGNVFGIQAAASQPSCDSSSKTNSRSTPVSAPFASAFALPAGARSPQLVMEKREGTSPPFTFKAVTPYPTLDPTFTDPFHLLPASSAADDTPAAAGGAGGGFASRAAKSAFGTSAFPSSTQKSNAFASPAWPSAGSTAASTGQSPDATGQTQQEQSGGGKGFGTLTSETTPAAAVFGRGTAAAAEAASLSPFSSPAVSPPTDFVWICSECRKVKPLDGAHLKGKTSVRSDCWPCGKKRLFILVNRAELSRRSPSISASRPQTSVGSLSPLAKTNLLSQLTSAAPSSAATGTSTSATTSASTFFTATATPPAFRGTATAGAAPPSFRAFGAFTASAAREREKALDASSVRSSGLFGDRAENQGATHGKASGAAGSGWWCVPVIPANEAVTGFYLLPEDEDDELSPEAVFCTTTTAAATATATVTITASQRMQSLFNAQLLHSYRLRIVEGVPLRAVWSDNVLYVIAEEPPASTLRLLSGTSNRSSSNNNSGPGGSVVPAGEPKQHRLVQEGNRAYEIMGRFAALLMAVENKLAISRFRRMRRLFCASPFSFAACCCYASQFIHVHGNGNSENQAGTATAAAAPGGGGGGAAAAPFIVYGPSPDITTTPTIWHRIIDSCPLAEPCIVSEEQRLHAAQRLYRRVSWLAMPADMTGAAIQLDKEESDVRQKKKFLPRDAEETNAAGAGEAAKDDDAEDFTSWAAAKAFNDGVDVVLLPGTMQLEDLPAAAALALPLKQF